jgi:L-threonylcarbamoyladenylate synthase
VITADLVVVADALERGEVCAVPTDTVFGIAARLDRPQAIAAVFSAKNRPANVALPVLVSSTAMAKQLVGELDVVAEALMETHWPGALTVVVACPEALARSVGAERELGLRMPDDARLLELLAMTGPLATTSCNLHGLPPVTSPEDAALVVGDRGVVFAGFPRGERSSTVVAVRGGVITVLREGPVIVHD